MSGWNGKRYQYFMRVCKGFIRSYTGLSCLRAGERNAGSPLAGAVPATVYDEFVPFARLDVVISHHLKVQA